MDASRRTPWEQQGRLRWAGWADLWRTVAPT
eukprot:CAMPEP_0179315144 /NCGR_PEP_ID=MMETSP0797-20121207/54891_1 /TAXON_ID=47934 /ORGANISM="Dinophysis acuminata, Strain DAEP01" /LENGTH=30 /DNA_ID= /DNA_START= /DNA_END= /DNA_ORIENTATION=